MPGAVNHAPKIDLKKLTKISICHFFKKLADGYTCVIDKQIHATMLPQDFEPGGNYIFLFGNIRPVNANVLSAAGKNLPECLQFFKVDIQ